VGIFFFCLHEARSRNAECRDELLLLLLLLLLLHLRYPSFSISRVLN